MFARLADILSVHRRLAGNIVTLYVVQGLAYALPLVTVPYLTRTLGAETWGSTAFLQSFSGYFTLVVEFGFMFSATREVAQNKNHPEHCGALLGHVTLAKLILTGGAIVVGMVLFWSVSLFQSMGALYWCALFLGCSQGFSFLWFFLGLEQPRMASLVEILCKSLAAIGIFSLVHGPGDAWKYLFLQATALLAAASAQLVLAYRVVPFIKPGLAGAFRQVRTASRVVLFRAAETVYTTGNPFLLGIFADPRQVAYFAGAERICRGFFVGMMDPMHRSMYPLLAAKMVESRAAASQFLWTILLSSGLVASALSATAYFAGDSIVHLILGPEFAGSVRILHIIAPLPLLITLKWVFGFHWMLACSMDGVLNRLIVISALIHMAIGTALSLHFQAAGMAYAVLITEAWIPLAAYCQSKRRQMAPTLDSCRNDSST
ncbi:MAG: oligosaccharide flippase family protein [Acidobacteria bacterium]|nr:oligosaccharide flippase family protein [Acidobacteriota bacterium]